MKYWKPMEVCHRIHWPRSKSSWGWQHVGRELMKQIIWSNRINSCLKDCMESKKVTTRGARESIALKRWARGELLAIGVAWSVKLMGQGQVAISVLRTRWLRLLLQIWSYKRLILLKKILNPNSRNKYKKVNVKMHISTSVERAWINELSQLKSMRPKPNSNLARLQYQT